MRNDNQNTPQLAQIALFGREPITVHQKEKKPEMPPQPQPRLSVVYGTCCKCGERPATLKSPSGKFIYCSECGRSRCGMHTIADFEWDEQTGLWLDPHCIKRNWKQQSLLEK